MPLSMNRASMAAIAQDADAAYPNECCGFLLGRANGEERFVEATVPARNDFERDERFHRFLITPRAYLDGEKVARERGLDIVGFYHSHPDAPARPSPYDLDHAWPWYSYVIVGISATGPGEATSWVLNDDRSQFLSEALAIEG